MKRVLIGILTLTMILALSLSASAAMEERADNSMKVVKTLNTQGGAMENTVYKHKIKADESYANTNSRYPQRTTYANSYRNTRVEERTPVRDTLRERVIEVRKVAAGSEVVKRLGSTSSVQQQVKVPSLAPQIMQGISKSAVKIVEDKDIVVEERMTVRSSKSRLYNPNTYAGMKYQRYMERRGIDSEPVERIKTL